MSAEVRPEVQDVVAARKRTCSFLRLLVSQITGLAPREINIHVESSASDPLFIVVVPRYNAAEPDIQEAGLFMELRKDEWARGLRILPRLKERYL